MAQSLGVLKTAALSHSRTTLFVFVPALQQKLFESRESMLIVWSSLGPSAAAELDGAQLDGRKNCPVGAVIEEYYKLKMADHAAAIKAANWPSESPLPQENESVSEAKAAMLKASQALLAHWQVCEDCKRQPAASSGSK